LSFWQYRYVLTTLESTLVFCCHSDNIIYTDHSSICISVLLSFWQYRNVRTTLESPLVFCCHSDNIDMYGPQFYLHYCFVVIHNLEMYRPHFYLHCCFVVILTIYICTDHNSIYIGVLLSFWQYRNVLTILLSTLVFCCHSDNIEIYWSHFYLHYVQTTLLSTLMFSCQCDNIEMYWPEFYLHWCLSLQNYPNYAGVLFGMLGTWPIPMELGISAMFW
jgi:hypothetical protein